MYVCLRIIFYSQYPYWPFAFRTCIQLYRLLHLTRFPLIMNIFQFVRFFVPECPEGCGLWRFKLEHSFYTVNYLVDTFFYHFNK